MFPQVDTGGDNNAAQYLRADAIHGSFENVPDIGLDTAETFRDFLVGQLALTAKAQGKGEDVPFLVGENMADRVVDRFNVQLPMALGLFIGNQLQIPGAQVRRHRIRAMGFDVGMRGNDAYLVFEDHPERRFEGNPFLLAPQRGNHGRLEGFLHEITLLVR